MSWFIRKRQHLLLKINIIKYKRFMYTTTIWYWKIVTSLLSKKRNDFNELYWDFSFIVGNTKFNIMKFYSNSDGIYFNCNSKFAFLNAISFNQLILANRLLALLISIILNSSEQIITFKVLNRFFFWRNFSQFFCPFDFIIKILSLLSL